MGKCLVTKLNGSSDNSKLMRLGEMRIGISKHPSPNHWTQGFYISFNKETTLEIIGDGYFTDINLVENKGNKITLSPNNDQYIYVSNGDSEIAVLNKYALVKLIDYDTYSAGNSSYAHKNKFISDINSLKYSTALSYLNLPNTLVAGNVVGLKALTALTYLSLSNTQITGNVGDLKALTSLTYLDLSSTQVTGDVKDLKTLTNLTSLYLYNTQITGNIGDLKTLTALTSLYLYNTQVPLTGDIGELSVLSKCTEISLKYSKITGDLATLPASCRYVSFLADKGSTLTWSTRSSSSKIIAIEGNAHLTNIDKMLQEQAQCKVGFNSGDKSWFKTISVVGNRTSASDAAVQTLQSKGYTVSITSA